MIFEETLLKYDSSVKEAIDELFLKASTNQQNDTDLLLVLQNALKTDTEYPYRIGPHFVGLRHISFNSFVNQYTSTISKKSDHQAELDKSPFQRNYIYHYMIEQELLIYMKFWETDLILRRLYNLTRLARGLSYEWEYKQAFFNERRKVVKEEIQKGLESITPKFNHLIDEIYSRQLRNAIAHSQYYLLYDKINLTNKDESPYYILESVSYDEWEERFHKNILMYSHLIRSINEYSLKYQADAKDKHFGLMVVLPEKDIHGLNKKGWLKFDNNRWFWYNQ